MKFEFVSFREKWDNCGCGWPYPCCEPEDKLLMSISLYPRMPFGWDAMTPESNTEEKTIGNRTHVTLRSALLDGAIIKINPPCAFPNPQFSATLVLSSQNPDIPVGTGVVALARQMRQKDQNTLPLFEDLLCKRKTIDTNCPKAKRKKVKQSNEVHRDNSLVALCLRFFTSNKVLFLSKDPTSLGFSVNILMQHVVSSNPAFITPNDIQWFMRSPSITNFFFKGLKHFQESDLIRCLRNYHFTSLSDSVAVRSPDFEFDFSECSQITGTVLDYLREEGCASISKLNLSGCHQVSETNLIQFLEFIQLDLLTSFSLRSCASISSRALTRILEIGKLSSLQTVDLSYCPHLTDQHIKLLLENAPHLTSISIEHCPQVSVHSLELIHQYCDNLIGLMISGMKNITEQSLRLIVKYEATLEVLHMDKCVSFVSPSFDKILRACQKMTDLDISNCSLSTSSIANIASSEKPFKKLKMVNANAGQNLLSLLSRCGQHLQLLHMSGTLIDDKVLSAIPRCCPNIKEIDISFCRNISSQGVHTLINECKDLKILHLWGVFASIPKGLEKPSLRITGKSFQ